MVAEETYFELPMLVFIDTNTFEELNFSFSCDSMCKFLRYCNGSQIRLITTDIISVEIRRRIKKSAVAARNTIKNHKETRRKLRLLGHDENTWRMLNDSKYFKDVESKVVEKYDLFLKEANAEVLPVDEVKPSLIFNKYFEIQPPFAVGNKEKEFPDAFAIESLLLYAKNKCQIIHVVSSDKGFKSACEQNKELIYYSSLDAFLERVMKVVDAAESELIDECHDWLSENDLIQLMADELDSVEISLNTQWERINSRTCVGYETSDVAVIELNESSAVMTGTIDLETRLDVEYEIAGENTYYDSNDKLIIPIEDIHEKLEVFFLFPFRLVLDIKDGKIIKLREISFDMADKVMISPDNYAEYDIRSEP